MIRNDIEFYAMYRESLRDRQRVNSRRRDRRNATVAGAIALSLSRTLLFMSHRLKDWADERLPERAA